METKKLIENVIKRLWGIHRGRGLISSEIDSLFYHIAAQDAEIAGLKAELKIRNFKIHELLEPEVTARGEVIEKRDAEIAELRREIAVRDRAIEIMQRAANTISHSPSTRSAMLKARAELEAADADGKKIEKMPDKELREFKRLCLNRFSGNGYVCGDVHAKKLLKLFDHISAQDAEIEAFRHRTETCPTCGSTVTYTTPDGVTR